MSYINFLPISDMQILSKHFPIPIATDTDIRSLFPQNCRKCLKRFQHVRRKTWVSQYRIFIGGKKTNNRYYIIMLNMGPIISVELFYQTSRPKIHVSCDQSKYFCLIGRFLFYGFPLCESPLCILQNR